MFRTWVRDLGLDARFAVPGGRGGWTRTLLTAVGGALLPVAAAVPAMLSARSERGFERDYSWFNDRPKQFASMVLREPAGPVSATTTSGVCCSRPTATGRCCRRASKPCRPPARRRSPPR